MPFRDSIVSARLMPPLHETKTLFHGDLSSDPQMPKLYQVARRRVKNRAHMG